MPYNANKTEQEMLELWKKNKTFEKSVEQRPADKPYVFYDGPPFATGLPHYGHILSSVAKDVVPRYWTMKGYRVRRRWGWDCHGLPIESLIEKKLEISGKKDIEEKIGVDQFNETCRTAVLKYATDWKKMVDRMGRWIEFDNAYKTMDNTYMESIWWALKNIWDKGLIYEGRKVLMYCPRCETPVAKAEIAMDHSYKDVTEESVIAKFKVTEKNKVLASIDGDIYLLAWTTTPWTLPGNVGLAVGKDIEYTLVKFDGVHYVVAKERLMHVFDTNTQEFEVVAQLKGADLLDIPYEPLFDMPAMRETGKRAWYVMPGDFVTTEDGTGIVHTAVVYGEDDYQLGLQFDLPIVPMLDQKGHYTDVAPEFARGKYYKEAEKEIKRELDGRGLFFARNQHTHSYPHCWRCDTQLIYNAISAWFINIQKIKSRLVKLNENIDWFPDHLKHGRFLNILETAPDWNISRNRYWATALPFWKCETEDCNEVACIGNIDELRKKSGEQLTKIVFVRHAESEMNVRNIQSCSPDIFPLTKVGEKQAKAYAKTVDEDIDVVIASPLLRTKQTAEIIAKKIGKDVITDEALREYGWGEWNSLEREELEKLESYQEYKKVTSLEEKFAYRLGGNGETRQEVIDRVRAFVEKINKEYAGKTVMLVAHGGVYAALSHALRNTSFGQYFVDQDVPYVTPHPFYVDTDNTEFDLHKHRVDKVTMPCESCGGTMQRIPEVIDCWFEAGSMPYAEFHYPFENKDQFEQRFPGQYIAEYIAQTRAWFYYMHVVSTLLFDSHSFEHVVTTGTILNEKGEKLSKSKQNYTDPWEIIDQYGMDALRYYLMTSVVMQSENLLFNDREVRDVYNKVLNSVTNVLTFYEMKKEQTSDVGLQTSDNVLDTWILAKQQVMIEEMTCYMDKYDLVKAGRLIQPFIEDLSQWYVRRSRDRFKDDGADAQAALSTLRHVLLTLAKLMAPFTPFVAERIYQSVGTGESVHLEEWPEVEKKLVHEKAIEEMAVARKVVEMGMSLRKDAGVRVRQPLGSYVVNTKQVKDVLQIVAEELNVKNVEYAEEVADDENVVVKEDGTLKVALNTEITPELKKEGLLREVTRAINQMRKEQKLTAQDHAALAYTTDDEMLKSVFTDFVDDIKRQTRVTDIQDGGDQEIEIDGKKVKMSLVR